MTAVTVDYWNRRWIDGPSCPGSIGDAALDKAAWVNQAVRDLDIGSVVDWGCGDGGLAALFDVPVYVGVEVARTAWLAASQTLGTTVGRTVILAPPGTLVVVRAEMAMSLDVVFHLVDDDEYEHWLARLFGSATRFVAIYGTDYDSEPVAHMRHRHVTRDAPAEWVLIEAALDPETPGWYLWER